VGSERFFVKTAGDPAAVGALLDHAGRGAVLEHAAIFARSVDHPAVPELLNIIASATGPMLVYAWASGDLLHAAHESRTDRQSAFQRFRALPLAELLVALGVIFDAHAHFAEKGWIACDLYDGSIIYDFEKKEVHLIDLDHYHRGPFTNEMGR